MTLPLSAGDKGMGAVLLSFADASVTTKSVRIGVTSGMAGMQWTGDSSIVYDASMNRWLDGLSQVEKGLAEMDRAMQEHQVRTTAAEQLSHERANFIR